MSMKKTIIESTLKGDLCIGCGICAAICPQNAINMDHNKRNVYSPIIDYNLCINCGECVKYCPNGFERLKGHAAEVAKVSDFRMYGLEKADYYIAYNKNDSERIRSASGGIGTWIIKKMFENDYIDAVVHAEMDCAKTGEIHYISSISKTYDEADKKRRSFYCSISFEKTLKKIVEEDIHRCLLIGTPCVIRAIKFLFNNHKNYKGRKIYTVALACGHNVYGNFVDYLADSLDIQRGIKYYIDLRNKDNISDAGNFKNVFLDINGNEIKSIDRYESEFTDQWRNYSFSMRGCLMCSDFWGAEADVSLKDAWGKWSDEDPLGENIVVVRNKELNNLFINSDDIFIEGLAEDIVKDSELPSQKLKHFYAKKKKKLKSPCFIPFLSKKHFHYSIMQMFSQKLYKKMNDKGRYDKSLIKVTLFIAKWMGRIEKYLKIGR